MITQARLEQLRAYNRQAKQRRQARGQREVPDRIRVDLRAYRREAGLAAYAVQAPPRKTGTP